VIKLSSGAKTSRDDHNLKCISYSWNRSEHVLNEFPWFCNKWTNECLVVL